MLTKTSITTKMDAPSLRKSCLKEAGRIHFVESRKTLYKMDGPASYQISFCGSKLTRNLSFSFVRPTRGISLYKNPGLSKNRKRHCAHPSQEDARSFWRPQPRTCQTRSSAILLCCTWWWSCFVAALFSLFLVVFSVFSFVPFSCMSSSCGSREKEGL